MKKQINTGVVSVSFRDRTPFEILTEMKKADLSFIEWGSDVHAPCHDKEKLFEIARLQREYDIVCSSYGTYFRFLETPTEELTSYIDAAKILETDVLRLWCGKISGMQMTDAEKEALLAECCAAAKIAKEHGVTLCLECHKNTFTENPDDAVWLMDQVNSQNFRMYWQPFQWQSAKQNVENAKTIAPYVKHVHVFNWKGGDKLPLGEAVNEWQEYLKHFSLPRTLLLEFMPDNQLSSLCTEADALRRIIDGLV